MTRVIELGMFWNARGLCTAIEVMDVVMERRKSRVETTQQKIKNDWIFILRFHSCVHGISLLPQTNED